MSTSVKSETDVTFPPLTLSDRCDATASGTEQGFTRWVKDGKSLVLCHHHHEATEIMLSATGWIVREDIRATALNLKPSPSANTEQFKETPED